jgi:hypothetical protein
MFDEQKDEPLDELLNDLLSEYSVVEPRPGLQTKILAGLRAAAAAQTGSWFKSPAWPWGGAGAAVVAVALLIFFIAQPGQSPPQRVVRRVEPAPIAGPQQVTSRPEAIRGGRGPQRARFSRAGVVGRRVHNGPRTPVVSTRADVFPTPAPLSEQEKLLLRYMAGTPREEKLAQSRPQAAENDSEETSESPHDMTQVLQRSSDTR